MGVFENLPYTNFHELNLEWVVKKIKELEDALASAEEAAEEAQEAAARAEAATVTTSFAMPILLDGSTPRAEVLYSHEPDSPSDSVVGIKAGSLGIVHAYLDVESITDGATSFIGYPRMYISGELKEYYFSNLVGNVVYTSGEDYCEIRQGSDHEGYTLFKYGTSTVGGEIEMLLIGTLTERS